MGIVYHGHSIQRQSSLSFKLAVVQLNDLANFWVAVENAPRFVTRSAREEGGGCEGAQ